MPKAVALIRCNALSVAAEHAAPAPAEALPIFLAGSCPLKSDGPSCGVVDFATWAVKCIEKMKDALAETGAGHEDVIPARILDPRTCTRRLSRTGGSSGGMGGHP